MKKKNLLFVISIAIFVVWISGCRKEIPYTHLHDAPSVPKIHIGQKYGGGIVFYVDSTGFHGLTTSTIDQSNSLKWFNGSFIQTSATGAKVGTGMENTNAIINAQGPGIYAAGICDNLKINDFGGWFLPSKDELNLLYLQKVNGKVGEFPCSFYWSSTESSNNGAWSQSFSNGANSSANKDGSYGVRVIRAF